MARLASPGYSNRNLLSTLAKIEDKIIEFKGLNRRTVLDDGEMPDMRNLSTDAYPVLSQRKLRGTMALPDDCTRPISIISKFGKIAMIGMDNSNPAVAGFWFDGTRVSAVTGISESTQMVAINTKICFFPEKKYLEITKSGPTITVGSFGSLEANAGTSSSAISATITQGTDKATFTTTITNCFADFAYDDAITIKGTLTYTSGGSSVTASIDTSCVIEAVSSDKKSIEILPETFLELTSAGASSGTFSGYIERKMPAIDFVIEWNNRLWGASDADNTIYACKLGDPKNWYYYQGTGLDSYAATQGTDGSWTGSGVYSGHVIFFKPSSMTRIYGTAPSNYQVTNTACYGVEEGSRKSVVTINDVVYYKSDIGIMAYSGSTPVCISDKFDSRFRYVVAGTEGTKYYASIQNADGFYELMVFDVDMALWMLEDRTRFRSCCTADNRLYFVENSENVSFCSSALMCSEWLLVGTGLTTSSVGIANPINPSETYANMEWEAEFGPFHEYLESKKIYSQISLRLKALTDSVVKVYISIDQGDWEKVCEYNLAETGGARIPIIPRRCDRYGIKIEGKGRCEILSLTRRVRVGTYGRL